MRMATAMNRYVNHSSEQRQYGQKLAEAQLKRLKWKP